MIVKKILWPIFIFFSIGVGLYPLLYALVDMSGGLLVSKGELINSLIWPIAFYTHITLGGLALFIGWIQFSKRIRTKYLKLHRRIGNVYLISVLLSGLTGLYIAYFASGGIAAQLGFGCLAIFWLFTGWKAYNSIRNKDIESHKNWMIRNYALTWAAVMLRLWIPIFQLGFGLEFIFAYQIISWFCWVPNLALAEFWLIKRIANPA